MVIFGWPIDIKYPVSVRPIIDKLVGPEMSRWIASLPNINPIQEILLALEIAFKRQGFQIKLHHRYFSAQIQVSQVSMELLDREFKVYSRFEIVNEYLERFQRGDKKAEEKLVNLAKEMARDNALSYLEQQATMPCASVERSRFTKYGYELSKFGFDEKFDIVFDFLQHPIFRKAFVDESRRVIGYQDNEILVVKFPGDKAEGFYSDVAASYLAEFAVALKR